MAQAGLGSPAVIVIGAGVAAQDEVALAGWAAGLAQRQVAG